MQTSPLLDWPGQRICGRLRVLMVCGDRKTESYVGNWLEQQLGEADFMVEQDLKLVRGRSGLRRLVRLIARVGHGPHRLLFLRNAQAPPKRHLDLIWQALGRVRSRLEVITAISTVPEGRGEDPMVARLESLIAPDLVLKFDPVPAVITRDRGSRRLRW